MSDLAGTAEERDTATKLSPRSVIDTVARLTELVRTRGMKLLAVIDQAEEARAVGMSLRPIVLVLFGNPAAGTPIMASSPLAGLDLPLKVLVWADGEQTKVSYAKPGTLAARCHLGPELAGNLAGIDPLTDELVAP